MTLEECYAAIGADYDGVLRRFMTAERIKRFVTKLPADNNFNMLKDAIESKDFELAFRAAHTLKGLGLNLGLTQLADSSAKLSDALRSGNPTEGYETIYEQLCKDYNQAIDAINCLD